MAFRQEHAQLPTLRHGLVTEPSMKISHLQIAQEVDSGYNISGTRGRTQDCKEFDIGYQGYSNLLTFEELDAGCEMGFDFRLLNSAKLQSICKNSRVWTAKGFKSFLSTEQMKVSSSHFTSSWIQRWASPSHRARSYEICDMMGTFVNAADSISASVDTPAFQNSKLSMQDLCGGPLAVPAKVKSSRVFNTASRRNYSAEETHSAQLEPCLAPRYLPTIEALLPSYSKKVGGKSHSTEEQSLTSASQCTGFSSEAKPAFLVRDRVKVFCSLEGAGTPSTFGCKSLNAGKNFYKPAERMCGAERDSIWRRARAKNELDKSVGKCSSSAFNGLFGRWTDTQKRHYFQREDHVAETSANEIRQLKSDLESRFQPTHVVSFPSVPRSGVSEDVAPQIDRMGYPTSKSAHQASYHREYAPSLHIARENSMCSVIGETSGANGVRCKNELDCGRLWKGPHCYREEESECFMDSTKAKEGRHLFSLRIASINQEVKKEGFDESSGSSSESHEEIEGYTLPGWNERSWLLSRDSLRIACRKRPQKDDGPSPSLSHGGCPLTTPSVWIKRLSARVDFQMHPTASREIEAFHLSGDNHALWPSKRARHDSFHDTLKREKCQFSFARQHARGY